jgi:hypothetical protein
MSSLTEKSLVIKAKIEELIHMHEQLKEANEMLNVKNLELAQQVLEENSIRMATTEELKAFQDRDILLNNEKQEFELLLKIAEEEKNELAQQKIAVVSQSEENNLLIESLKSDKKQTEIVLLEKEAFLETQIAEIESLKLRLMELEAEKKDSIAESTGLEQSAVSSELEQQLNQSITNLLEEKQSLELTITELLKEKVDFTERLQQQEGLNGDKISFEKQIEELQFETEIVKEELKIQLDAFNQEKIVLEHKVAQLEEDKDYLTQKLNAIGPENENLAASEIINKEEIEESALERQALLEKLHQVEGEKEALKAQLESLEENRQHDLVFAPGEENPGLNLFSDERQNLQNTINRLEGEKKELKTTINNLEERIKIIKLAKSLSDTDEKSFQAKLRINELVREIDKCIVLLNR